MGLGNNLLAYVNGMLLALCLGRALAINTHDPYPLHSVLEFVREEQIPPWRSRHGHGPPTTGGGARNIFMDQRDSLGELTCGDLREMDTHHILYLRNANQDVHLILSNPTCGAFLHSTFRGLPFFFLSHFVWSGHAQQEAKKSQKKKGAVNSIFMVYTVLTRRLLYFCFGRRGTPLNLRPRPDRGMVPAPSVKCNRWSRWQWGAGGY
jgi:hypothetical protein